MINLNHQYETRSGLPVRNLVLMEEPDVFHHAIFGQFKNRKGQWISTFWTRSGRCSETRNTEFDLVLKLREITVHYFIFEFKNYYGGYTSTTSNLYTTKESYIKHKERTLKGYEEAKILYEGETTVKVRDQNVRFI